MTSPEAPSDPGDYEPAEHTATVTDDDTRYVVDLRDCRVWRLTGVAALAWEWVLGVVTSEEAAEILHPADDESEAATRLRSLRDCCETLAAAGLLIRTGTQV